MSGCGRSNRRAMDLLHPLIPYIAAALGILAALVFFLSLKRELRRAMRRERARVEELLVNLRTPVPAEPEPVYIPVAVRPGLNISRRVHALRMLRRGDDTAHIAAALGIPRREVELLVRVQAMVKSVG